MTVLPVKFGEYELLEAIHSGDKAEVFRARSNRHEQDIVIKRLRHEVACDSARSATVAAVARAAASCSHPNLVKVHEGGAIDGWAYVCLELLDVLRLGDLLHEVERLSLHQVCLITVKVLRALECLHAIDVDGHPLLHAGVSPGNVLLTHSGEVKLTPFAMGGEMQYMAPEVLRGQAHDGRADLFSAGVLLWELTVNRGLFAAESSFMTVCKILNETIIPPSSLVSMAAESLTTFDAICVRALARNPDDRYRFASEMCADLLTFFSGITEDSVATQLGGIVSTVWPRSSDTARDSSDADSNLNEFPRQGIDRDSIPMGLQTVLLAAKHNALFAEAIIRDGSSAAAQWGIPLTRTEANILDAVAPPERQHMIDTIDGEAPCLNLTPPFHHQLLTGAAPDRPTPFRPRHDGLLQRIKRWFGKS